MLAKRIIPCLDVTNGRVVKGNQFLNLKDAGDPIELAQRYNQQGADELVFLDITASSNKQKILIDLVQRCAKQLFIPFTVGGGIQDLESMKELLHAGADKLSINSAAIRTPNLIYESSQKFGSQCIVVAIDAKRLSANTVRIPSTNVDPKLTITPNSRFEVYSHGGRRATGIDAIAWAKHVCKLGAGELLLTSMDQDGQKTGYDLDLCQAIKEVVNVPIIASGGAGTCLHIIEALHICDAALLASLLHFNDLSIEEIKLACRNHNIPIRELDC
ncbi:MAG: imidazole glycerol phosphate synthase subunit HisF [bacterium]